MVYEQYTVCLCTLYFLLKNESMVLCQLWRMRGDWWWREGGRGARGGGGVEDVQIYLPLHSFLARRNPGFYNFEDATKKRHDLKRECQEMCKGTVS
jgi:hypothetical protein